MFECVQDIFINGRKDVTLTIMKKNEKCYRQSIIENHHLVVGEPEEFYLSHVIPQDGTRNSIAGKIFEITKDTPLEEKTNILGSKGNSSGNSS